MTDDSCESFLTVARKFDRLHDSQYTLKLTPNIQFHCGDTTNDAEPDLGSDDEVPNHMPIQKLSIKFPLEKLEQSAPVQQPKSAILFEFRESQRIVPPAEPEAAHSDEEIRPDSDGKEEVKVKFKESQIRPKLQGRPHNSQSADKVNRSEFVSKN